MAATVLLTDRPFGDDRVERELLAAAGLELVRAPATDEATLAALARDCVGILACYAPVTARVIEAAAANGARIVARYGIGVDNVDVAAATRLGVHVANVPDYCLDEVADHALALLLAGVRGVAAAAQDVRDGRWAVPDGGVHRLRGRRLAVIGLGAIGRRVVARALPFGFEVVGCDPWAADVPAEVERAATVEEAIAEADAVTLHVPLTPDTEGLIGARAIAAMRRSPWIVNTSRGGLVDLDAALAALDDGRLAGLALDVTAPEPLPADHPLRRHPRAIITPHMAFYSEEALRELQTRAVEEVVRSVRGEPPRCPVNAPDGAPAGAAARDGAGRP